MGGEQPDHGGRASACCTNVDVCRPCSLVSVCQAMHWDVFGFHKTLMLPAASLLQGVDKLAACLTGRFGN